LSAGLEQFGQELVRPLTLSFKVSPVAARYRLHLNQLQPATSQFFGLGRSPFETPTSPNNSGKK
jgi:hypothetical protein